MTKNVSEQDVRKVLEKVKHPAIDASLIDLGIVKDIAVEGKKAIVTIAFPFPNIPIRDELIDSVTKPITTIGADCEIKETIMTEQERMVFLEKEQENWKGV